MPTYEHECDGYECGYAYEAYYSINAAIPDCPKCGKAGHRVISGGSGRGIVSLTGQDLVNKVKADANALENHATRSENFAANFVGDGLYSKKQQQIDNSKRDGSFRRKDW